MRQNEYAILEPIITSHTNQSDRDKKNKLLQTDVTKG